MGEIRVLDAARVETLLYGSIVGRIACADGGRPYLVPLAYGYDGEAIYAISPPGRKIQIMRSQPLVTFEVDHAVAEDDWQSVIAEATYEELTDDADRDRARRIVARTGPLPPLAAAAVVYRLRITAKSGREEIPG